MGGRELSPSITTSRAAGGIGCLPPPPPVQLRNNMFSSLPPSFYLRLFLVLLFCLSLHVTAASWYPAHAAPGTRLHLAACRLPGCSDTCSCVCTWVCMCVCMCVCTRACMHICMRIIPTSMAALALGSHFVGCLCQGGLRLKKGGFHSRKGVGVWSRMCCIQLRSCACPAAPANTQQRPACRMLLRIFHAVL